MTTTLNPTTVRAFLLLSATMLTAAAGAAPQFLPPKAGDLVPARVIAPDTMQKSAGAPKLAREAVHMSWAVDGAIATAPQAFVGQSREYYTEVTADQLAAGITLHTTAPRALVRLQPLAATGAREKVGIQPLSLVLTSPAGRAFAAGSGMEMLASADKLAKADVPFAEGTSAFRIHPELGSGAFTLRAADAQGNMRYLVNVVEPDSPYTLAMQTDAPSYLHGQQVVIAPELEVQDGGNRVAARLAPGKLEGVVVSPAGRRFPVMFRKDADGRMRARVPLDADEAPSPGLWEVQAGSQAIVRGQLVQRTLRVAFAVAMPVARLDQRVAIANEPGSVGFRLGVDVGAAGRYEARALLYGMVGGVQKPLAVAHSAQWLEPGAQSLVLRYDANLLTGASGPFELRDLNLIDQGRMSVMQRQQRAILVEERDLQRNGAQATMAKAPLREKLAPKNN